MSRRYDDAQLPTFPDHSPVMLHYRQLAEFREAYRELTEFAAAICGISAKELRVADTVSKLMELRPPETMTKEQLRYWATRPSYMTWRMLVELRGRG